MLAREGSMKLSRRHLLAAGTASLLGGTIAAPFVARAQAPQFSYKYANNLPETHPMNVRARQMAAAIKQETSGRFELQIFPSSQLGSDTDTLTQIRSGGVEFFTLSGLILSTFVPVASINGMGFAFPSYDTVWKGWTATSALMCATRSPRPISSRWRRFGITASGRPR